jgi:hypothetical protein
VADLAQFSVATSSAARGYVGADTTNAQIAGAIGAFLGDQPVLLPLVAGAAAQGVLAHFAGGWLAGQIAGDPDAAAQAFARTTGELTENGRAASMAALASGVLVGLLPGRASGEVNVPLTSAVLRLLTGEPRPAVTVPLDDPPELAVPVGLAGVTRSVAAANGTHAPPGRVVIQRLSHDKAPPSWVVTIAGTQSWSLGSDVATDISTNLAEVGGVPDQMTAGVLAAMTAAGIKPTDPVLVAGHSQGGMTAQAVAANAGDKFSVRALVTIAAPTIPQAVPSSVGASALGEIQEAVDGLDGAPGTAVRPNWLVVRGDVTEGHGPTPGPFVTHHLENYLRLAAAADAALAEEGRQAPGLSEVLDDVSDSETFVYQVTRDPAVVAAARR